jgi:dihydropteroate synthase
MTRTEHNMPSASVEVMAIVNITPDSFFSSSRNNAYDDVVRRVEQSVAEGADILDLGGYSSRPGANDISVDEEWRRVQMGLDAVRSVGGDVRVSIDTFRSEIVRRAYEHYGRFTVNDISAGEQDEHMVATVARLGLEYVAMHMRGRSDTMQSLTQYDNGVVADVEQYLRRRADELVAEGIERDRIILDPGYGFAKSVEQNWQLLDVVEPLCKDYKVLVGVSRKSMIYKPLGLSPEDVLPGSLALAWEAMRRGACVLRVHDVAATRQVADMYNYYKTLMR